MTFTYLSRLSSLPVVVALVALAGCGDDDRTVSDMGAADMRGMDTVAPTVRSTTPADGSTDVSRTEPLVIRFSEPMDTSLGTVTAMPGGMLPRPRWVWDGVGSTLTIPPNGPWPAGEVQIQITDFADPAGNALAEPYELQFTTIDDVAPFATASTPMEGATDVSAALNEITLTFSEQMDTTVGSIAVLGGAGTVGGAEWSGDGTTVTFPVHDLEYEREYDVELRAFRDAFDNALDPEPYLNDGVLDFTTGIDDEAPFVVRSDPAEGQLDVNPAATETVVVTFNESMDETITTVSLSDGTLTTDVNGSWQDSGRLLRIPVAGLLAFDTAYAIDLGGMRDRRGNALDGATYLLDGNLDFTVSNDVFDPFVRDSTPREGTLDVSFRGPLAIDLSYSEAMDPAFDTAMLSGGGSSWALTGTWSTATTIAFTVPDELAAETAYSLDLSALRDLTGNATDATHRYLADGRLDFTTAEAVGESCRDPLTTADATADGSAWVWTIAPNQVTQRQGGTAACDNYTFSSSGDDVVIAYDKASADVAGGGKLLRVRVESGYYVDYLDVAITPGACDPGATPNRCIADGTAHDVFADVPAGPVHIWVANQSGALDRETAIRVEEVDPPRAEGESCDNPFTTSSAIHSSVGPGRDRWVIPENSITSMDMVPFTDIGGTRVSCDPSSSSELGFGVDAVVRYTKPANTVLRVAGDAQGSFGHHEINISTHPTCAAETEMSCDGNISTSGSEEIIDVPAGDVWFWLTADQPGARGTSSDFDAYIFPEFILDIEAIPVAEGEICSRAFAASPGTNTVAGTSTQGGLIQPSCFDAGSDVEWYRLTTSQPLLIVGSDAPGGVALYEADSTAEVRCSDDAAINPVSTRLPAGTDVCIAVEMGRSIGSITVDEQTYSGLGVSPGVPLPIERPIDGSGRTASITNDKWLSVSGGTLVYSWSTTEMLEANSDGSGMSLYRGAADGLSDANLGNTGAFAASGALFAFDDSLSFNGSRVWRLWDGSAPIWDPIPWDFATSYVSQKIAAAAVVGDTLYYVTDGAVPYFYALDATSPGAPTFLGSNASLQGAVGLAVDDTHVYVAAETAADAREGVYRLLLADLSATPVSIAPGIDIDHSLSPSNPVPVFVSSSSAPAYLYVRNARGHVEAIQGPATSAPVYIGEVITAGDGTDEAMWLDPITGSLYLFETESSSSGAFVRFDL